MALPGRQPARSDRDSPATGYRIATVGFLREYHRRSGLDLARFRETPALDETVYRDYAERLVPRAVTYSTALIDYFFRGRMAAFGNDVALTIQNGSEEAMNGTFPLYYDDANDARRPVPGASWTQSLGPNAFVTDLRVTTPTSPAPKELGKYMLVFRGALGSETDAVVGKQVAIESVQRPAEHEHVLAQLDRKSTRLNSSHANTSYAAFSLST